MVANPDLKHMISIRELLQKIGIRISDKHPVLVELIFDLIKMLEGLRNNNFCNKKIFVT
jgi:hypothetical protein